MTTSQELIVAFITNCNEAKIPYAIARNYEDYPDFAHDLDIFCYPSDYLALRNLLLNLVSEEWDYCSEILSYAGSRFADQNVNCIKLFNSKNDNFLQVDFFYGLTFGGMTHIDVKDILKSRELDLSERFFKINKDIEMYYRTFQISARYLYEGPSEKVIYYCNNWLNYFAERTRFFQSDILSQKDLYLLISFLERGLYREFSIHVRSKKVRFMLRSFIKSPDFMSRRVFERLSGLIREFLTMPSGVNVFYSGVVGCGFEEQLNLLSQRQVIPGWGYKKSLGLLKRIRLKERGGVVLVENKNASNQDGMSKSQVKRLLLLKIFK